MERTVRARANPHVRGAILGFLGLKIVLAECSSSASAIVRI